MSLSETRNSSSAGRLARPTKATTSRVRSRAPTTRRLRSKKSFVRLRKIRIASAMSRMMLTLTSAKISRLVASGTPAGAPWSQNSTAVSAAMRLAIASAQSRFRRSSGLIGRRAGARGGGLAVEQPLELVHELGDVLELAVDRGEAHVGHVVELLQARHDALADRVARDLLLAELEQLVLDLLDDALDRGGAHGALLAGLLDAGEDLVAVEGLAAPVLLDDGREDLLDPLVGGEAALALEALAPSPDDLAVLAGARVDHPVLEVGAEGAAHATGPRRRRCSAAPRRPPRAARARVRRGSLPRRRRSRMPELISIFEQITQGCAVQ